MQYNYWKLLLLYQLGLQLGLTSYTVSQKEITAGKCLTPTVSVSLSPVTAYC